MAKDQYSSGDVMKMLNISRMALRYYMKKGLVTGYKDEENGYHYFDENDLLDLKDIVHLRQTLDFSVEEIRDYLYSDSLDDYRSLVKKRMESLENEIEEKRNQLRSLNNWWGLLDELDTYASFEVVNYELTYLVLKFPISCEDDYWRYYYDNRIGKEVIAPFRIYEMQDDAFVLSELGFYCAVDSNICSLLDTENYTTEILAPGRYLFGLLRGKGTPYEESFFAPVKDYIVKNHIKVVPRAYTSVYLVDRRSEDRECIYDMMLPVLED